MDGRPRVGISACLLGERVRYDGGHKHAPALLAALGPLVDWVAVCPEAEAGFGTPRDPMRLATPRPAMGQGAAVPADDLRLVVIGTGEDVTERLRSLACRRVEELAAARLSGYVLKAGSPSCGLAGVAVFRDGMDVGVSRGLFAHALVARLPDLPVEDEARLADPRVRGSFIARVFAYHECNHEGPRTRRHSISEENPPS